MSWVEVLFLATYFLVLLILSIYGSHRYVMAYLYYKYKGNLPTPRGRFAEAPRVTIQLPVFNEMYVVERLIDAVARIEYPKGRLEIQVLDDSTDETQGIARAKVERLQRDGIDINYIHRDNRAGFKAGALQHGLKVASGELVAVFDADFVPSKDFLLRSVNYFTDPQLADPRHERVERASTGYIGNRHPSQVCRIEERPHGSSWIVNCDVEEHRRKIAGLPNAGIDESRAQGRKVFAQMCAYLGKLRLVEQVQAAYQLIFKEVVPRDEQGGHCQGCCARVPQRKSGTNRFHSS